MGGLLTRSFLTNCNSLVPAVCLQPQPPPSTPDGCRNNYALTVIGMPKTIDNDVYPIKQSLGAWVLPPCIAITPSMCIHIPTSTTLLDATSVTLVVPLPTDSGWCT